MAKFWLPMQQPSIRQLVIRENGRERVVIIPLTGDRGHDAELVAWQEESTRNQLKKMPAPKPPMTVATRQAIGKQLKEFIDYAHKKQEDPGYKKVF